MKKFALVVFILTLWMSSSTAQDQHFTQFYASPLTLNPALTGAFNGRYRVSTIYRDQWRGALESPYVTFSGAVDVRFDLDFNNRYKDVFAIGLAFFNDKVSNIDFVTNQIAISGAYHKALDYNKKQYLTLGIQGALAQRNINYENLSFNDQFNGISGYTFASGEDLPENNFSYPDFSVGLNYSYTISRNASLFAGFAMHHVFTPQVSFYKPDEDGNEGGDSKLYRRLSGQLSAQFPLTETVSMLPRVLFAVQGPHLEITTGTNFRFKLNDFTSNAIQIGGWVRPVSNEDNSFSLDAVAMQVGLEFNSFLIGISYDVNLEDLINYNEGQNAFEISLTYLGNYDDETILCPKF